MFYPDWKSLEKQVQIERRLLRGLTAPQIFSSLIMRGVRIQMFNESLIEGYEASSVYLIIEDGVSKKNTEINNLEAEG